MPNSRPLLAACTSGNAKCGWGSPGMHLVVIDQSAANKIGNRIMESGSTPSKSPGGLTVTLFVAAVLIGGINFIAVRFSNRELDPFWGAGLRFGFAATLFIVIALVLKLRPPRGRDFWMTVLYGLLSFAISYALMYWALVRVNAGLAAVVLAVVPLVTVLLASAHGMERLTIRSMLGSGLAIAGILWMTLGPEGIVLPFTALVAMLLAVVSISESVIVSKKVSANHPGDDQCSRNDGGCSSPFGDLRSGR